MPASAARDRPAARARPLRADGRPELGDVACRGQRDEQGHGPRPDPREVVEPREADQAGQDQRHAGELRHDGADRTDDDEHDRQDGQRDRHDPVPVVMMAGAMCRNIKTLFNFDPPATDEEVRAASLQFVRKLSGFTRPSQANQAVFDAAVEDVAQVARRLIDDLVTTAPSRDRAEVAARARARAAERFGRAAAP